MANTALKRDAKIQRLLRQLFEAEYDQEKWHEQLDLNNTNL